MILIRFHDICIGKLAKVTSTLINTGRLLPAVPRLIDRLLSKLGVSILSRRMSTDGRVVLDNISSILGLTEESAKLEYKKYLKNRSSRLIIDSLISKKYYNKYTISEHYTEGADYPESGCVFALMHMVEPYLIPGVVGNMITNKGEERFFFLRSPLSEEEGRQFDSIASGFNILGNVKYLDPSTSQSLKTSIRTLRSGGKLLSFIDMPTEFGRSSAIQLFGRQAWIALGAIDIAKLAKVPVYLCYLERDQENESHLILNLNRVESNEPDSAQQVARLMERAILQAPSDWDFLSSLRSYYYHPGE